MPKRICHSNEAKDSAVLGWLGWTLLMLLTCQGALLMTGSSTGRKNLQLLFNLNLDASLIND